MFVSCKNYSKRRIKNMILESLIFSLINSAFFQCIHLFSFYCACFHPALFPFFFKCSILCIFFQTIGDTVLFIMDTFSYEVYFVGENYTLFRAKLAKFKNTENIQVLPILLLPKILGHLS